MYSVRPDEATAIHLQDALPAQAANRKGGAIAPSRGFHAAQLTKVTSMTDKLREKFRCIFGVLQCLNFMRKGESGQKLMVHVLPFFQNRDILRKNQI